ncbi:2873_t:CDS:2 [Paraglomus occultum]|uniref:2873_t:CDS:1 n=1 Tax=Paraglomus occultum TaxID=144539 RepID=A0A9N9FZI7_9GLOM|nr:2873_t:CDS:2 [Paraglomus occultum]
MSSSAPTWAKVVEQSKTAPTEKKLFACSECSVSLAKYSPKIKTPSPSGKYPVFFDLSSTLATHEEIAGALPPGILGIHWRDDLNILEVDVLTGQEQTDLLAKPLDKTSKRTYRLCSHPGASAAPPLGTVWQGPRDKGACLVALSAKNLPDLQNCWAQLFLLSSEESEVSTYTTVAVSHSGGETTIITSPTPTQYGPPLPPDEDDDGYEEALFSGSPEAMRELLSRQGSPSPSPSKARTPPTPASKRSSTKKSRNK